MKIQQSSPFFYLQPLAFFYLRTITNHRLKITYHTSHKTNFFYERTNHKSPRRRRRRGLLWPDLPPPPAKLSPPLLPWLVPAGAGTRGVSGMDAGRRVEHGRWEACARRWRRREARRRRTWALGARRQRRRKECSRIGREATVEKEGGKRRMREGGREIGRGPKVIDTEKTIKNTWVLYNITVFYYYIAVSL